MEAAMQLRLIPAWIRARRAARPRPWKPVKVQSSRPRPWRWQNYTTGWQDDDDDLAKPLVYGPAKRPKHWRAVDCIPGTKPDPAAHIPRGLEALGLRLEARLQFAWELFRDWGMLYELRVHARPTGTVWLHDVRATPAGAAAWHEDATPGNKTVLGGDLTVTQHVDCLVARHRGEDSEADPVTDDADEVVYRGSQLRYEAYEPDGGKLELLASIERKADDIRGPGGERLYGADEYLDELSSIVKPPSGGWERLVQVVDEDEEHELKRRRTR